MFPEAEMVCTKTLYNALSSGHLPLTLFDVPELLSRRKTRTNRGRNKRVLGRSIDERPEIANQKSEIGHWEIDTALGKRKGKEAVVLTIIEKLTHKFITIKIANKTSESVEKAMSQLRECFSTKFSTVFKTITSDNGSEFAELSKQEQYGTEVYFAHAYSSYERPQNKRHNRIFRKYVPKGKSIETYSAEQILKFADEINNTPRKVLYYQTPDELFDEYLDEVYAA
jgi:transposase